MDKKKGKDYNNSSSRAGEQTYPHHYSPKQKDLNTSRSKDRYEDLDVSQTNESGFREGGVYLYDPYDASNFHRANHQSPITQGRQTTAATGGNISRSPDPYKKSVFDNVRNEFGVGKKDDLSAMTINIPKRGVPGSKVRENSPGLVATNSDEDRGDGMNTYVPRRVKRSSGNVPNLEKNKPRAGYGIYFNKL